MWFYAEIRIPLDTYPVKSKFDLILRNSIFIVVVKFKQKRFRIKSKNKNLSTYRCFQIKLKMFLKVVFCLRHNLRN